MEGIDKKKLLMVGFFVNVFEWYDFSVFAFLASAIGVIFFNETNPHIYLIKAFMVFLISYLARPFGSIFFGYLADHYGRALALKSSLLLMAIPTFLIGLLPTYHVAGNLALTLLILLRLLQGFAAGGELPGSTCYMYEASPDEEKNFYCSLVAASSMLGVFMGSFTVTLLYTVFSKENMLSWGWRIPFLFGFIIAIFIFYVRNMIAETDTFQKIKSLRLNRNYFKNLLQYKRQISQVFLLNSFISVSFYTLFVWMPSYLTVYLNIKESMAHLTNTISLFALIIFTLLIGYVSRTRDRKKWILCGVITMLIFSYPLFIFLQLKKIAILIAVQIVFALFLSFIDGVINATMGSLFHPQIRAMGIGIGFTFSTAIFGGLSPMLSSWLASYEARVEYPVILIIITAIVALPAVRWLYKDQENFSA